MTTFTLYRRLCAGALLMLLGLLAGMSAIAHTVTAPVSWLSLYSDLVVGLPLTRSCNWYEVPFMYEMEARYCTLYLPEAVAYLTVGYDNRIQYVSFSPTQLTVGQVVQIWGAARWRPRSRWRLCWPGKGYAYVWTRPQFFSLNNRVHYLSLSTTVAC